MTRKKLPSLLTLLGERFILSLTKKSPKAETWKAEKDNSYYLIPDRRLKNCDLIQSRIAIERLVDSEQGTQ